MIEAQVRETLSQAFKNITQGKKNEANADAQQVMAALKTLETYMLGDDGNTDQNNPGGASE